MIKRFIIRVAFSLVKTSMPFLVLLCSNLYAQKINLNGYVVDYYTGEKLSGTTITYENHKSISNSYGYFNMVLESTVSTLVFSGVGYKSKEITVRTLKDTTVNVELVPTVVDLEEVTVTGKSDISQSSVGYVNIPINRIKSIPIMFGEADIMKALSLTPGVTTGNEGTTGLLVRGGTPDQNLILLDDAVVYNTAHLFGLVSVFNTDAVKSVEMYKAGFPARYGGRLSSVFDISMKEGNSNERKTEITVGLISSRLLLEGPIPVKNERIGKASYLFAARSSYLTAFLLPKYVLFKAGKTSNYFNYWLYDINAKVNYHFNDKSQLFFSIYNGNDYWSAYDGVTADRGKAGLQWGNTTITARYNYVIHPKLFLKSIFSFSNYHYNISSESFEKIGKKWIENSFIRSSSTVNDWTNKTNLEYFINSKQSAKIGIQASLYQYRPTTVRTSFELPPDSLLKINTSIFNNEISAFGEYEVEVGNWLKTNIGGRLIMMSVNDKTYENFEPRLSLNFILPYKIALKGAYTKMNQYIHLLSSNSVGLPNDVWVPATESVSPASSKQYAFGLSKKIGNNIEVSVDLYEKTLENLIDYSTSSSFFESFNKPWQSLIEKNGIGRIKGLEVFINKTKGSITGWVGYTASKNERQFENIDNGNWYASNFDRRHVATFVGSYTNPVTNNIFSFAWTYQSGAPVSMPIAVHRQFDEGQTINLKNPVFLYGSRNNVRLPSYHRLDLSYTFEIRRSRKGDAKLTLGVYNAYNRVNPYYLTLNVKSYPAQNPSMTFSSYEGFSSSVSKYGVLPFLPYFNYNVKI